MSSAPTANRAERPLAGEDRASGDAAPDVPTWAVVIGAVLVLLFLGLGANAYFGNGLLDRLRALRTPSGPVAVTGGLRAYYSRSDVASAGMASYGTRGQDRLLQPGDIVLLGGSGQLVKLESNGVTELVADGGTTVVVHNIGRWDEAAGRLSGQTARHINGRWEIDQPTLTGSFPIEGLRDAELPAGFALVPNPEVGQSRLVDNRDGTALRIRAVEYHPFIGLQTHALASMPEGVAVTVWAEVRARENTTIGMTVTDIVDADGTSEQVIEQWPSPKGWTRISVQRRLVFRAPEDRISIGLIDPRAGDWIEVRDFGIFVGALP